MAEIGESAGKRDVRGRRGLGGDLAFGAVARHASISDARDGVLLIPSFVDSTDNGIHGLLSAIHEVILLSTEHYVAVERLNREER